MTRTAAAAILTAVIIIAIYETRTPDTITEYHVEVYERTVHTDLDDLNRQFAQLADDLRRECLLIIHQQTGDPIAGIEHHVTRHYQGDACAAADEALRGNW